MNSPVSELFRGSGACSRQRGGREGVGLEQDRKDHIKGLDKTGAQGTCVKILPLSHFPRRMAHAHFGFVGLDRMGFPTTYVVRNYSEAVTPMLCRQ